MNIELESWDRAIANLDEDIELKLFETEIGMFDLADDPRTAMDSWSITTAAYDREEAEEQAQEFVENRVLVLKQVTFMPMGPSSEI